MSSNHFIIRYFLPQHTNNPCHVSCGNDEISPNECDTTPSLYIDTLSCIPVLADSIRNFYESSQGPSYPSNANFPPEEYGLIS